MKLPRITRVFEVIFVLKSGASLTRKFTKFSCRYTAEAITDMKWTTADGSLFYIVLNDVAAISQGDSRLTIKFRDK